jgi:spermidine/putrescine transport system substrate-binding protein
VFGDVWFDVVDCNVVAVGIEEETMKLFLLFLFIFISFTARAAEVLNVYNWSNYMPDDVIQQFEKETGIDVNYTTYDSNETMYAKLKADPNAGYDIVVPSTYFIDRMQRQDMLKKIDKSKLTNFKHLNPDLLNKPYDPHNNYSIPYLWGTSAIVVNDKYFPKGAITSWADFWSEKLHDQLLLLDDTREVFGMALITLGYSANDTNPQHIQQAYEKLKALLPNVKLFNDEAVQNIYIDEDVTIGMGWTGDIFQANEENPHVQFIYPKEGFIISMDSLAIPKGAQHIENAYKFINFLLRPDIAKKISMEVGYSTPNLTALKMMPKNILNNRIISPDSATLRRGQYQTDVGSTDKVYEKYLELLKMGA